MRISRKHWDMINQVRVLLKSVTGEVDTPKAIWKLVYTAIGYVSSFFASAVLLKDLTGFDKLELLIKGNWEIVVIVGLLFHVCIIVRKLIVAKRYLTAICKLQLVLGTFSKIELPTVTSYLQILFSVLRWITSISVQTVFKDGSSSSILRGNYTTLTS